MSSLSSFVLTGFIAIVIVAALIMLERIGGYKYVLDFINRKKSFPKNEPELHKPPFRRTLWIHYLGNKFAYNGAKPTNGGKYNLLNSDGRPIKEVKLTNLRLTADSMARLLFRGETNNLTIEITDDQTYEKMSNKIETLEEQAGALRRDYSTNLRSIGNLAKQTAKVENEVWHARNKGKTPQITYIKNSKNIQPQAQQEQQGDD